MRLLSIEHMFVGDETRPGAVAERSAQLPPGFEEWEPGLFMAAVVTSVDRSRLSDYESVVLMKAEAKLISHFQAGLYETMAQVSSVVPYAEAAPDEVAAALRLTRAAATGEHALAMGLALHPRIGEELRSGRIDVRRARVLVEGLAGADRDTATLVLDRLLEPASRLTTGQLRTRIARLRFELDPERADDDHEEALATRRVVATANPDGTGNLFGFNLSARDVTAARKRIEALARQARAPGDERTMDQVRADVFTDLLLGTGKSGPNRATVDIVVPLETLMELSNAPGEIPGFGPVTAEIARQIVAEQVDGKWEYIVTDQGQPIATGTIRRRPTAAMKRHIRAKHPTCIWPGCRMPARQSDLDHNKPWSRGGKTTVGNIGPLCEHHHQTKDEGWTITRTPDGDHIFTSPLGHTYTTSGADPPRT